MKLLLKFCNDNQAVSPEQSNEILTMFERACETALQRQKADMNGLKETYELVNAIALFVTNNKLSIPEEKDYIPGYADGVIRKTTICFDPDRLNETLKGLLGIQKLSTPVINKQLIEAGLLETDKSASNTKKVFGKRMIVLNRKRFVNYIETVKTDFLQ